MPLRWPASASIHSTAPESQVANTLKAYHRPPGTTAPSYPPINSRPVRISNISPYQPRRNKPIPPARAGAANLHLYELNLTGAAPCGERFAASEGSNREGFRINGLRMAKAPHDGLLDQDLVVEECALGDDVIDIPPMPSTDLLQRKLEGLRIFSEKSTVVSYETKSKDTSRYNHIKWIENKPTTWFHLYQARYWARRASQNKRKEKHRVADVFFSMAADHRFMAHNNSDSFSPTYSGGSPYISRRKAIEERETLEYLTKRSLEAQDGGNIEQANHSAMIAREIEYMIDSHNEYAMHAFFAQRNQDHPFIALRQEPGNGPFRYANSAYPKIAYGSLTFLTSFASDLEELPSQNSDQEIQTRLASVDLRQLLVEEVLKLLRAHLEQCRSYGVTSTDVLYSNSSDIRQKISDLLHTEKWGEAVSYCKEHDDAKTFGAVISLR